MKKILILPLALFFLVQGSMAQTPKWVEKAKRAVFSVVTYDKNDKMLNTGNGFFVSEDGLALSDFSLFKGAERAVVVTADGKQMPVSRILGANDMYDVIKFRVGITEKKVPALVVATAAPAVGSDAWMLPYSTQKSIACVSGKVKEVSKVAGEYHYYTLSMQMKDKMVSCPVMNAEGQVFGIAQKSSGLDTITTCYAAGGGFCDGAEDQCPFSGGCNVEKHWYPEGIARNGRPGIGLFVYGFLSDGGRRLWRTLG